MDSQGPSLALPPPQHFSDPLATALFPSPIRSDASEPRTALAPTPAPARAPGSHVIVQPIPEAPAAAADAADAQPTTQC